MRFLRTTKNYINTDYISNIEWDCYDPETGFTNYENNLSWFVVYVVADGHRYAIIRRPVQSILEPLEDVEFDRKAVITQLGQLCISSITEPLNKTQEDININVDSLIGQLKQVLVNTVNNMNGGK